MIFKKVDADTLNIWMENQEVLIVDVREPEEYALGNIPGSILIPLGTLTVKALPKLGNKKLVIHCKFGKRGSIACEKLLIEDPNLEVYNLEGGISAWLQAGYPI